MMPVGYEFGFRRQVNVVHTMPADWERHHFDLRAFVAGVNRRKRRFASLRGEGTLRAPMGLVGDALVLRRTAGEPGAAPAYILVNKRTDGEVRVPLDGAAFASHRLHRVCRDDAPQEGEPVPAQVALAPAEVAWVLPPEEG
jgi:starch synthase (maltosyl-transferring)